MAGGASNELLIPRFSNGERRLLRAMRPRGFTIASVRLACVMVVVLASSRRASAAALSARSMATHGGDVVSKTVTSDKMRLVFVLGLEGTGHHYITGSSKALFQAHTDLPEIERGFPGKTPYFLPIIMKESAAAFNRARENARTDMRDLARRADRIPFPGTFHLLLGHSIPMGGGGQKVMQYVDPRLMAEAAEAEGVDFRVLYLKRSARQILLANTAHRQFQNNLGNRGRRNPEEGFMEYVRVMFTDIAVVQSFLAELDPAFVVCHDWRLLGDPEQAQSIADFVAPNADVASLVRDALLDSPLARPAHEVNETHRFDDADVLSSRIQQKFDSFEGLYCGRHQTERAI